MHNYVNISYGFLLSIASSCSSVRSWSSFLPRARSIPIITQARTRELLEERIGARRLFQSIRRSPDCYRLLGVRHFVRSAGPVPINVRPRARTGQNYSLPLSRSVRRVISTAHCPRLPWPGRWSITIVAGNTKDVLPRPRAEGYVTPRAKVDSRCGPSV